MRTVVKHRYIKNNGLGLERARAHVRYIAYRPDRSGINEHRVFFNGSKEVILPGKILQRLEEVSGQVLIHKVILSPGVANAAMEDYTRAVMRDLSAKRGVDIEWYAVSHDNTDHDHCHIVIIGTGKSGRALRIGRQDHLLMRQAGDAYLEKHKLLPKEPTRSRQPLYARLFDAMKAAHKSFVERWSQSDKQDKDDRLVSWAQRRAEEEARALGDKRSTEEAYAANLAAIERLLRRKERLWRKYVRPIQIKYKAGEEVVQYTHLTQLSILRRLEKDYLEGREDVVQSMTDRDLARLQQWIKDSWSREKQLAGKAEQVRLIEIDFKEGGIRTFSKESATADLEALESEHVRGNIMLKEEEIVALRTWLKQAHQNASQKQINKKHIDKERSSND